MTPSMPSVVPPRGGNSLGDDAAVGPGEGLETVVGGVKDDGVVIDAQLLEPGEKAADIIIVLEHAVWLIRKQQLYL